jgi:hypothetical protein
MTKFLKKAQECVKEDNVDVGEYLFTLYLVGSYATL